MSRLFQHDGINIWKSTFRIFPAAYVESVACHPNSSPNQQQH